MRRPTRVIQSTFFAMLALQSFGTIDAKHRMPPPRAFVALCFLWGLLHLMADTGLGRVAARLSVLVLVTATVLGPFGKRLISIMDIVSKRFGISVVNPTAPADTDSSATSSSLTPEAV